MHFLRRHQYLFCFLGVLFFSCVMVIRQFEKNQARHVELREDFILLHDRGETKSEERLYHMLIDPKAPQLDNLIWKYEVSVKNELQKRSEQRLARAREEAAR